MDKKTLNFLKEWLKENLTVDVESCYKYGPGLSVMVGLRFSGDDYPFCSEQIYISDQDTL